MADPIVTDPVHVFDETGTLPENYVENEVRYPPDGDHRAVFARFGSFYINGFNIRDGNGNIVTKDKYLYALYRGELSAKVAQDVISAVIITDSTIPSPFYIDYHAVGGPWGASNELIIDMYNKLMADNRSIAWPDILGKPDQYKPAHHFQDIGDLYGAEYWVEAIERMANAFLMGDNASHDEIWRRIDEIYRELKQDLFDLNVALRAYIAQQVAILNARITAVDQRLTNVRSELLAADAVINQRITTVQAQLQAAINVVSAALTSHVGNTANPHQTTAAQVGAYTIAQVDAQIAALRNSLNGYVRKDFPEELALTNGGGQSMIYLGGGWRVFWPPQWQD